MTASVKPFESTARVPPVASAHTQSRCVSEQVELKTAALFLSRRKPQLEPEMERKKRRSQLNTHTHTPPCAAGLVQEYDYRVIYITT